MGAAHEPAMEGVLHRDVRRVARATAHLVEDVVARQPFADGPGRVGERVGIVAMQSGAHLTDDPVVLGLPVGLLVERAEREFLALGLLPPLRHHRPPRARATDRLDRLGRERRSRSPRAAVGVAPARRAPRCDPGTNLRTARDVVNTSRLYLCCSIAAEPRTVGPAGNRAPNGRRTIAAMRNNVPQYFLPCNTARTACATTERAGAPRPGAPRAPSSSGRPDARLRTGRRPCRRRCRCAPPTVPSAVRASS